MADIATNNAGYARSWGIDRQPEPLGVSSPMFDRGLEQVTIETIHVGDYVFVAPPGHAIAARCVIAKCAKAAARTARVVGWVVELSDGELAWWPRSATVWRRRIA